MDKYMRAVYALGIEVHQLNVYSHRTGQLELRVFTDEPATG